MPLDSLGVARAILVPFCKTLTTNSNVHRKQNWRKSSILFRRFFRFFLPKRLKDYLHFQRFERDVEKSRSEFHSQVDKFEKAKEEDFFNDTDTEILGKRVEDLKKRWDQLWGEHINNKNR